MENEEIKESDLIFKAYQRMLLRDLNEMQEAIHRGEKMTLEQILEKLIADTKLSLAD